MINLRFCDVRGNIMHDSWGYFLYRPCYQANSQDPSSYPRAMYHWAITIAVLAMLTYAHNHTIRQAFLLAWNSQDRRWTWLVSFICKPVQRGETRHTQTCETPQCCMTHTHTHTRLHETFSFSYHDSMRIKICRLYLTSWFSKIIKSRVIQIELCLSLNSMQSWELKLGGSVFSCCHM